MSYFEDIYTKRLNRFGNNYQTRLQGEREKLFGLYLARSVYKVTIPYGDSSIVGSFEKYKQDETETLHYLLTDVDVMLDTGTLLTITNVNGVADQWMVYYLENMQASGYNRYILLKMTHSITWNDRNGNEQQLMGYVHGRGETAIQLLERNNGVQYAENDSDFYAIMPNSFDLNIADYFSLGTDHFRVVGFDRQSTPGIMFVTLDPIYEFDLTPAPTPVSGDDETEFFWLQGGSPVIPEVEEGE